MVMVLKSQIESRGKSFFNLSYKYKRVNSVYWTAPPGVIRIFVIDNNMVEIENHSDKDISLEFFVMGE